MKFDKIDTFVLKYTEPNDFNNDRYTLLVRIETNEGVVGWGEGIAMWPEACKASEFIAREGLFPIIKEYSPLDIEKCWQAMKNHIWWYGFKNSGIANFAISAIDMALWDIKGKSFGQPLYKLLGGKQNEKLPVNASIHVNQATVSESINNIQGYFEQGFKSVKLGFAKKGLSKVGKVSPDYDVNFIKEVRSAVGDEPDIMVDIGNGVEWDVATAIKTTKRMQEYDIRWIEEPLYPTDIKGYKALKSQVYTMISSGEREWCFEDYQELVEYDCVDIFGIDPARVQGITAYSKIQDLVASNHRYVNAHAWSTAITTAASLHCSLASNNCLVFELKPLPVSVQFDIVEEPILQKDGWVTLDESPGLGLDVKEKELLKLTIVHESLSA